MILLHLLGVLIALVKCTSGAAILTSESMTQNLSTDAISNEAPGVNQLPWLVCNSLPRYNIPIARQECQEIYNRVIKRPQSSSQQGWHGINTPITLTKESDSCVMRLETNRRDRSDTFRLSTLAYVGVSISRKCILGGAASIGEEGFCKQYIQCLSPSPLEKKTSRLAYSLVVAVDAPLRSQFRRRKTC